MSAPSAKRRRVAALQIEPIYFTATRGAAASAKASRNGCKCVRIALSSRAVGCSGFTAAGGAPWCSRQRRSRAEASVSLSPLASRNSCSGSAATCPLRASFATGKPRSARRRRARSAPERKSPWRSPTPTIPAARCSCCKRAAHINTSNSPAPSRTTSPGDHGAARNTATPAAGVAVRGLAATISSPSTPTNRRVGCGDRAIGIARLRSSQCAAGPAVVRTLIFFLSGGDGKSGVHRWSMPFARLGPWLRA